MLSVSIPLEQGSVLRRCYSCWHRGGSGVSIPLEQGSVLRRLVDGRFGRAERSQSLWNRAVSYDHSI